MRKASRDLALTHVSSSEIPAGLCQCGCGATTSKKYINGHNKRKYHLEYSFDPEIGFGNCHCGCGEKTNIASNTDAAIGNVQGKPMRFVRGHQTRLRTPPYSIDAKTQCWIWQRTVSSDGYARIKIGNRMLSASRYYYQRAKGSIPPGLEIDHLCRNPSCVNPDHLEPVTGVENVRRGTTPKINLEIAGEIKRRLATGSATQVASQLGVSVHIIYHIKHGRTWRDA